MKKLISGAIAMLFSGLVGFSQTDYVTYTGNGKVILNTGEEVSGKVEYTLFAPERVSVLPDGQDKESRYKADEVKSFTIDEKNFAAIKIKGGAITVTGSKVFARLLTAPDSKIKVYITETQPKVILDGNYPITTDYYASVPGDETGIGLADLKFNPCKKLTQYISDCPALVAKIEGKEKGYFYPMMTTDEARKEVLLTIAREYQDCK